MAKTSTKPRKKTKQVADNILDHLGVTQNDDDGGDDGAASDEQTALLERIAALEAQTKQLSATNAALMTTPAPSNPTPAAPKKQEVDMDGLPDPITEPDKYAKELNKRIMASVQSNLSAQREAERAAADAAQEERDRADGLWSEFQELYPDLAENQDFVDFAASKVVKKAQSRGRDVTRYIYTTREVFFNDVADEIKKSFGDVLKPSDENEVDDTDDDDTSRSEGIFSGHPLAASTKQSKKDKEDAGDMLKDLRDLQKESGFF